MNKKLLFAGLLSLSLHGVASAGAIIGATEPTQILNNIQLLMSYVEQAQQTITQFNQYQTMLKNLQQMTPSSALDAQAQKLWQDQNMMRTFMDLRKVVIAGQQTSYALSNLDAQFKRAHPGYGRNAQDLTKAPPDRSNNTLGTTKRNPPPSKIPPPGSTNKTGPTRDWGERKRHHKEPWWIGKKTPWMQ